MRKGAIHRRGFLKASAMGGVAASVADAVPPQAGGAPALDVTRRLAAWAVSARKEDVPAAIRHEALRTILNWTGCAVGGSRHDTVEIAMRAVRPFSGPAQATVVGRKERLDVLSAALLNGISSHVFDFDDTDLRTVVHPAAPVAPALLALAEYHRVTGADFLQALIVGVEVECRIANAVYPQHYDIGWHITGTVGPFGAAAAAGRVLGLSERQMVWALGLAATQPVGLRCMFGTMTKSFHPGRASQNGLMAAFLAQQGFTSSEQPIEALRGWANVLSTARDYHRITDGLGSEYQIAHNTYKPFPCGVVIHPAIDGVLQLRAANHLSAGAVDRIELRVHPLVLELTGNKAPRTGLESKFSVYHAVAAAMVYGRVGEAAFSDEAARDGAVVALRERVSATVDPGIGEDQVRMTVVLKDGRRMERFVEHAVGSAGNPMTDGQLESKFRGLVESVLPAGRLMEFCWKLEGAPDAGELARLAAG
ncbi:MAG TPA: MmgE/PrpD family protein [Bryobacteraceae bacterium]|jgi:2-methylcitrate dehydratase PrpD|nr:MmgE/PrpD family protein [Bryobacteraceae bacterium]